MPQLNLTPETAADEAARKAAAQWKYWQGEIEQARKREKNFRKLGAEVIALYEAEKEHKYQFNILYSNTETMLPALYNSVPRPEVQRRFKDDDPPGKAAAGMLQRALEFQLDTDLEGYPSFDELMQAATLEALVPGRGLTRFRYDATFSKVSTAPEALEEEAAEGPGEDGTPEHEAAGGESESSDNTIEKVSSELVCGEVVPWNRFLHGYATKWKNVPWVAFELPMTKEEFADNFGEELAALCEWTSIETEKSDESDGRREANTETATQGAWVYEIWDKRTRKVYFVTESLKERLLKVVTDPLNLSGFFPCPRPMMLFSPISSLTPVALYQFYKEQAEELNRVTVRINKIVSALKVRGFYDSTIEGLDKVMTADDNVLIPAENVSALQQGQTLEKAIFLMPIDKLVAVLQQLYAQRAQVKQVIYEITGIADIMRGASVASETLGAQELKNQWGTLRLKRAQKEVQRYARDCLRIMAEITSTQLSPTTLKAMTGVALPLEAEKQQAAAIAQQAAMSGQPPPPEIQAALGQPSVEQLLQLLSNDLQRAYRINIETNSTIDAEATDDKQDMSELMNAIAQFLNGVAPAVQSGVMPFEAAKAMLLGIVRKFRFGGDVEDLLKQTQPPQPPQEKQDPKNSPELVQAQVQAETAKTQATMQTLQLQMQFAEREHEMKMEELALRQREMLMKHELEMQKMTQQAMALPPARGKPAGITKK